MIDSGENGSNGQLVPKGVEGVRTEPGSVTSPRMVTKNVLEQVFKLRPVTIIVKVGKYHNSMGSVTTKKYLQ